MIGHQDLKENEDSSIMWAWRIIKAGSPDGL
jgi:hypothetical protein